MTTNEQERQRLDRVLRQLNLPKGRWVLSGSGVMVLHGMDRKMGDVDIFIATRCWFDLLATGLWQVYTTDPDDFKRRADPPYLYRTVGDIEVNVFFDWRKRGVGDIDVNFWLHNAEYVGGWPCIPLAFILYWKQEVGRAKDYHDIVAIQEHLGKGEAA